MGRADLDRWDVEDPAFWASEGRRTAFRNLWTSVPALLQAFAIWIMWGMIIVQMKKLGFTLGLPQHSAEDLKRCNELLWTLPAIAGLSGATLRIPNSFLIAIGGGRNTVMVTTVLLLLPAFGAAWALRDPSTPYGVFAALAVLSGLGGGNFASSMSNITSFFPKRMQGLALGLNAGLGNLGVSVMQASMPVVILTGCFGALAGSGLPLVEPDGLKPAGTLVFIQNAGWVWVPFLSLSVIAAWGLMNNLRTATPTDERSVARFMSILLLVGLGLAAAAVGAYLLAALKMNMWLVLPITIILALALMRYASPVRIRSNLARQFAIFRMKHNWVMTVLYVMTFGSFIGYSASFPKLIQDVFGYLPDGRVNPAAPDPMRWAFVGPLLGAVIRPIGGWLSDRIGSGSRVTAWSTAVQVAAALGAAHTITLARQAPSPEVYWWPFFALFIVLFAASGVGNGSTFRSIPYIFPKDMAGPVLGWTSAVAAYGAFIIPIVFGQQIKAGHAEYALYGFTAYYGVCLVLNWYYYDRKNSGVRC